MFPQFTGISIRALYRLPIAHLAGVLSFLVLSSGIALAATTDDELFAVAATLLDSPCAEPCERESFSVTPLGSRRVAVMSGERFKSSEAALYLIRSNDANCQGEAPDCEAAIVVSDGRSWRFLASSGEGYDYLTQVRMIETGRFRELTEPETPVVTQDAATGSVQADKLCEARGMSPLADQINEFLTAGPARLSDANGEEVAEIKNRAVVWPGGQVNGPITEIGAGTICVEGADEKKNCLRVYRCQSGEAGFVLADETGRDIGLLQMPDQLEQRETVQGAAATDQTTRPEGVHKIRGFTNQGIVFTLWVETQRRESGVLVRLLDAEASHNAAANFNAVGAQEAFDMALYVVTRKDCKNCRPGFVQQSGMAWRFADGQLMETTPPLEVFVPDQALTDADEMNFSFLARAADRGILFMSPDRIPTHSLLSSSPGEAQSGIVPSEGALSQGAAAIAQGLLSDYGNDMERITKVADHADMALLAWAAYGQPEALAAARERGWTAMESIVNENIFGGDTAAVRFAAEDGRQVLAFRGSKTFGDWYTNIAGTLKSSPVTTAQISGGVEIALLMKHQFPDIVFVGHSLGGRLAQIARLRTGNKAIVFNSAPLNIEETAESGVRRLIEALMGRPGDKADILFFRNRGDGITALSFRNQIDVSNVVTAEGVEGFARLSRTVLATYFVVEQKEVYHNMGMLAGAMQQVRIARDEGWLAAYLRKQDGTDGEMAKADVSAAQEWGPEIVAPEGFTLDQWLSCEKQDQIECLRSAGFSEPALDFVEMFGERAAGGFARSFRELGQVDLVETELYHAPWRSYYFVNGSQREILVTVPTPAFPESYGDSASKNILAGVDPMGGDWGNVEVVSHRQKPGKGQRFVATSLVTSGCRACPFVGIAVRQFDFDAKGKLVAETMLGLMDWRGREYTRKYEGAAVLRDTALAQFLLNIRGYDAGPMNGDFGARSRVALATFQAEHCLPRTRILDPASAEALATNDFFSNMCEGDEVDTNTTTADAAPVATQASGPDQSAGCAAIESDIARLECFDAAVAVAQDDQQTGGRLEREDAARLIAESEAADERRGKVYITSRAWDEARQRDIFRPNGSWELFPSPAISGDVSGGLPGGKLLELTPSAMSRTSLVIEVTGMTQIGDTGARVEFLWRYRGLPSWIAEGARASGASTAELRLYDDGWRVVEASFQIGSDECSAEQNERNSQGWAAFLGGGC